MQATQVNDTPNRAMGGGVSAVSWGAIMAGTAVAAASSLLLFALAAGLDLASLSSWPRRGPSAASVTTLAAITLVVTQWISAGLGGYITGRLRTSWVGTHTHEVFFRDTAHGFITWCVATVLLASGVFSPAPSSPSAALRTGAVAALGAPTACAATACPQAGPSSATLLAPAAAPAAALPEAGLRSHELLVQPEPAVVEPGESGEPRESRPLLLVTPASNEVSPGRRNPFVEAQLANAADAREAATSSVLTALSMLIGAFIASVCAALGGRLRDQHP